MANMNASDAIITIVSSNRDGPDLQPHLHVHEQLLVGSSPILQKLLQPVHIVVTRIKPARLELDLPYEGLRLLTQWLYHRELEASSGTDSSTRLIELIHASHAGEKLEIVDFVDNCTDSILQLLDSVSEVSSVAKTMPTIVRYTLPDSRLRKLLVDWLVRGDYKSLGNDSWKAFASDEAFGCMLVGASFKRKLEHDIHLHHVGQFHAIAPCAWHWHAEIGRPCYRKATVTPESDVAAAGKLRVKVLCDQAVEPQVDARAPDAAMVDPAQPT